jgi:SpoVK/Ycf46/Vps4 family AAA+-type ATPase
MLFIATCNSIAILPPELKRRFTLGTFFFPLPDTAGRAKIWKIYQRKYPVIKDMEIPDDTGWTGAEIANCAKLADDLNITLVEAAANIVPVSISDAEGIDQLCRNSHRRYLSALTPGVYEYEKLTQQPVTTGTSRRMELS